MKKNFMRMTALACAMLLTFALAGCSLLEKVTGNPVANTPPQDTMPMEQENGTVYTLPRETSFHEMPDNTSFVVTVLPEGHRVAYRAVVEYDGALWASSSNGWFVIEDAEANMCYLWDISKDGVSTAKDKVYAEPSADSAVIAEVKAGTPIHASQMIMNGDESWIKCDLGWFSAEHFEELLTNGPIGFGVIRHAGACFYAEPNIDSNVVGTPACGSRHEILQVVKIQNVPWIYTPEGWIPTDLIYQEGDVGFRACNAVVIDSTPLNVRLAPGTEHEVLTKLNHGEHVQILEQINYNGADWGYTGEGWIFMELTQVQ